MDWTGMARWMRGQACALVTAAVMALVAADGHWRWRIVLCLLVTAFFAVTARLSDEG